MTNRRTDRSIEQELSSWMDGVAPTQAPTRLLEDTFGETMKTRQLRAFPWSGLLTAGRESWDTSRPQRIALIGLAALLVAAASLVLVGGGAGPAPSASPTPGPTVRPTASPSPPPSGSVLPASVSITTEQTVPVPDLLGFEMDSTQLLGLIPGRIVRVDLATGTITDSVAVGKDTDLFNGFAANVDGLWATDWDNATLYRVDRTTFKVVAAIPAGFGPKGILANAAGVWVADTHYGTVMRIDPATNTIAAMTSVGPTGPSGPNWLAAGLASIWTDIPNNSTIVRVDPLTDLVQATIPTPAGFTGCGGIAVGTDAVWVSGCDASAAIGRFDPVSNKAVTVVPLPGHGGPTLIDDAPWVSVDTGDQNAGLLVRIDPATNTIDRVLVPDVPFGGGAGIIVVGATVWVHDWSHGRLLRFPLTAFRA